MRTDSYATEKMAISHKDRLNKEVVNKIYSHDFSERDYLILLNDIDKFDQDGRTLLIHAVLANNVSLVKRIVAQSNTIGQRDKVGWTALHYAAQGYAVDILKYLLTKHRDVDVQDNYGNTPLWRATFSSQGKGDAIVILLKAGADPHLKNNYGISPSDLAATTANYGVKSFFEIVD